MQSKQSYNFQLLCAEIIRGLRKKAAKNETKGERGQKKERKKKKKEKKEQRGKKKKAEM